MKELESALCEVYRGINRKAFGGELPDIPVKVEAGHVYKAAARFRNGQPEAIIFDAHYLRPDADDVAATMLHEMIHVYCHLRGVPDYDADTGRHTQAFIAAAFDHGLLYDDDGNLNLMIWDAAELMPIKREVKE